MTTIMRQLKLLTKQESQSRVCIETGFKVLNNQELELGNEIVQRCCNIDKQ